MTTIPVQAQLKARSLWRSAEEVERMEGGLVRVLCQGRFYTVPEARVRPPKRRRVS